ncbi:hypothetical protein VP01_977g2 [Puccinia sorghi]|uniref:Uncharacterized protein n=1 Tax=Puccinia sorghi TaxID=27349 RepID=A0A0L6U5T9_9BASI|nr:hypothetical protein VP01_977g2 [Puccinia sorghi]
MIWFFFPHCPSYTSTFSRRQLRMSLVAQGLAAQGGRVAGFLKGERESLGLGQRRGDYKIITQVQAVFIQVPVVWVQTKRARWAVFKYVVGSHCDNYPEKVVRISWLDRANPPHPGKNLGTHVASAIHSTKVPFMNARCRERRGESSSKQRDQLRKKMKRLNELKLGWMVQKLNLDWLLGDEECMRVLSVDHLVVFHKFNYNKFQHTQTTTSSYLKMFKKGCRGYLCTAMYTHHVSCFLLQLNEYLVFFSSKRLLGHQNPAKNITVLFNLIYFLFCILNGNIPILDCATSLIHGLNSLQCKIPFYDVSQNQPQLRYKALQFSAVFNFIFPLPLSSSVDRPFSKRLILVLKIYWPLPWPLHSIHIWHPILTSFSFIQYYSELLEHAANEEICHKNKIQDASRFPSYPVPTGADSLKRLFGYLVAPPGLRERGSLPPSPMYPTTEMATCGQGILITSMMVAAPKCGRKMRSFCMLPMGKFLQVSEDNVPKFRGQLGDMCKKEYKLGRIGKKG